MSWQQPGNMSTEYDPTTERVLRSLAKFGTTEAEIEEDKDFLAELMQQVGNADASVPPLETIAVMDCAFIGLIYHRHMPFLDENGAVFHPEREPGDYYSTLASVGNAILSIHPTLTKRAVQGIATVACIRALRSMSHDAELHLLAKQFLALTSLGQMIHTFIDDLSEPDDREYPTQGDTHG